MWPAVVACGLPSPKATRLLEDLAASRSWSAYEVVAFCGSVARFRKLAVEPEWRRRGLATALIETAAAEARLAGAETLACDARASQADFYAARGFQRVSEPFDKYPGKGGELYVKMEMTL